MDARSRNICLAQGPNRLVHEFWWRADVERAPRQFWPGASLDLFFVKPSAALLSIRLTACSARAPPSARRRRRVPSRRVRRGRRCRARWCWRRAASRFGSARVSRMCRSMLMSGVMPMPPAMKTSSRSSGCSAYEKRPNGPSTSAVSPGFVLPIDAVKSPDSLIVELSTPASVGLDEIVQGCSSTGRFGAR